MQATSELTKLITHEVRNALVPVRHHIDAMRDKVIGTIVWALDRLGLVRTPALGRFGHR